MIITLTIKLTGLALLVNGDL